MCLLQSSLSLSSLFISGCVSCVKRKKKGCNECLLFFFLLPPETYPSADGCEYTPRKYQPLLWYKIFSGFLLYYSDFFIIFILVCVVYIYPGGVGRNLADGLSRLARRSPLFVSVVGDDESGRELIRHNPLMVISNATTAQFSYCSSAVSSECRFNWN